MDFLTTTVTLISLALTLSMGIISWRLVREERRRSDARIAALQAEFTRSTHTRADSDEVASMSGSHPTRWGNPGDEPEDVSSQRPNRPSHDSNTVLCPARRWPPVSGPRDDSPLRGSLALLR